MADIKISELTLVSQPYSGNELFETVQGGVSKKITLASVSPNGSTCNVYHVGQATGMFNSVQAAIDAINSGTPPSSDNRAIVYVWPGKYVTASTITVPSFVGIKGVSKGLVQFQNDETDMFRASGDNFFEDFLVEGSPTPTVYAFDGNNSNALHIRRVDMLNNGGLAKQKFLKQVGSSWIVLFIEDCIIDYRANSDYAVLLQNDSDTARIVDTNINNVFFDAYGLTSYGGSFLCRGVRDVRFKRSTIRGAATYNTGIRLEKHSADGTPTIEVKQCDFANLENLSGGVSIYNEVGTTVFVTNSDAPESIFSGTVVSRNSFTT